MDRKSIFIIDDELLIRDLLYDFFSEKGWRVSIFDSEENALEMLKNREYDIALLDIKAEKFDSLSFVKKVRNLYPVMPIVVMTAFPNVDTAVEALRMKLDDYISKPFNINKLYKTLDSIVEMSRKQRESVQSGHLEVK